ncbi:MAG: prephenate dehydrogenase [Stackebrandtia sp.]
MSESLASVGIIGLGLIGGSLLRALSRPATDRRPGRVVGFDESGDTRAAARRAGFQVADSPDELVDCDLLVLAVPLPALDGLLPRLAGFRGLLTDVTSVKQPVERLVRRHCPSVRFVGGHPMTGRASSGFSAGDGDLFTDRVWVLCLETETDISDVLAVGELVCGLGGRLVPSTAAEHDAAAARISHVPHVAAGALTLLAADPLSRTMAAGSFTDGTRVAASRPDLVTAMCVGNAGPVHEELDRLIAALTTARDRLSSSDDFRDWYAPAWRLRSGWPPAMDNAREIPVSKDDFLSLGREGGWIFDVDRLTATVMARYPRAPVA